MKTGPTAEEGTSGPRAREPKGFSLIEMLVVLAIFAALVGALIPLGYQIQTSADERETRTRLENLKRAMIGSGAEESSPGDRDFGFLGDIGDLPSELTRLVNQGSLPDYEIDSSTRLAAGWRGPYLRPGFEGDTAHLDQDAWGRPLRYRNTFAGGASEDTVLETGGDTIDAFLKSAGGDGAFGTDDDLSVRIRKDETTGRVVGFVSDTFGDPVASLDVNVIFRAGGNLDTTTVTTDSDGRYEAAGLPFGRVRVEALASGGCSSCGAGIEQTPSTTGTTDGQDNRQVVLQLFNNDPTAITLTSLTLDFPAASYNHAYYRLHFGGEGVSGGSRNVLDVTGDGVNDQQSIDFEDVTIEASGTPQGTVLASARPVLNGSNLLAPELVLVPGGGGLLNTVVRFEHFIDSDRLSGNRNANTNMSNASFSVTFTDSNGNTHTISFST